MQVLLRHPGTDAIKRAPVGWSWSLFLTAGSLMGIPLFLRGLAAWGAAVCALWALRLAVPFIATGEAAADRFDWIFVLLLVGLSVFFGLRGNTLAARHYFTCGYTFARPDSAEARIAAEEWGVEERSGLT